MDEYTPAACATCRQAVYLARWKLKENYWVCPGCGAENMALGTLKPKPTAHPPSRFVGRHGQQIAPVLLLRRHKKLPLMRRIAKRAGRPT